MIRDTHGRFVGHNEFSLYHNGREPDFDALNGDNRIRRQWNINDWTPGDYTYDESIDALRLTFDGSIIWRWDGNR